MEEPTIVGLMFGFILTYGLYILHMYVKNQDKVEKVNIFFKTFVNIRNSVTLFCLMDMIHKNPNGSSRQELRNLLKDALADVMGPRPSTCNL